MESSERRFNKEYLTNLLLRDKAICLTHDEKLIGSTLIKFQCSCGIETTKKFNEISYYTGAFCKDCIKKIRTNKIKKACIDKYGVENPSQIDEVKKKKEETYMEHYGMHPRKTKDVQDKYKNTCLAKYNVDNPSKNLKIQQKIKNVFESKYGGHPMHNEVIKQKVRETCFELYGGYPAENELIKKKIEEKFMEKYGCYPLQDISVLQKHQESSKKYKKYTMPSGQIRLIQGYEHFAIQELLKKYSEDQIQSERKNIPRFKYIKDEKERYYFPDIYIPTTKQIIEIKSSYTFEKDKEKLDLLKPCIEKEGYIFEIWIFDRKGNRIL
jgi:hypothetical protein